jgi:hypothetical protein
MKITLLHSAMLLSMLATSGSSIGVLIPIRRSTLEMGSKVIPIVAGLITFKQYMMKPSDEEHSRKSRASSDYSKSAKSTVNNRNTTAKASVLSQNWDNSKDSDSMSSDFGSSDDTPLPRNKLKSGVGTFVRPGIAGCAAGLATYAVAYFTSRYGFAISVDGQLEVIMQKLHTIESCPLAQRSFVTAPQELVRISDELFQLTSKSALIRSRGLVSDMRATLDALSTKLTGLQKHYTTDDKYQERCHKLLEQTEKLQLNVTANSVMLQELIAVK